MENIIKAIGRVHVVQKDKDGNILYEESGFNTVTAVGLAAIAGLVGNTGAVTAFTYLALGTGTTSPVIGDTTLEGEISSGTDSGLARTTATVSRTTTSQTNDTLNFVYTFTATTSQTIGKAGIFNASSVGVMLASKKFASTIALVAGNTLAVTYTIQFS